MTEAVIQVEKLGKRFHIGKLKAGTTLRDALTNAVKAAFRRRADDADTTLWALRDVSFEVKQGEVVGLIGRNGAGKSTLLKLLARVTRPTEGWAEIKGRIGSLLEVGTGFHPELSGRENVFLSGAILGMKKAEIQKKFDEIVAFSEVERFLDTPLKHYSSGMQTRLAFSVAAHLEPEILLVDEVLAVGDAAFQKKCLGKMKDVARHGRTIIFVSHNVAAVLRLCSRCLVLVGGRPIFDGDSRTAVADYYMPSEQATAAVTYAAQTCGNTPQLIAAYARTSAGDGNHEYGHPLVFEFDIAVPSACSGLCFSFQVVRDEDASPVCHFWLYNSEIEIGSAPGVRRLRCEVPFPRLYMGSYSLTTWLADRSSNTLFESVQSICKFTVRMLETQREQYEWQRGECAYLEDAQWDVIGDRLEV